MKNVIYLSYPLSPEDPAYGGGEALRLKQLKSIQAGDTANVFGIELPAHVGTHIDVPFHFFADGKKLDEFEAKDWVFEKVRFLDLPISSGRLLKSEDFRMLEVDQETELLLIKTGFCHRRGHDQSYIFDSPGFDQESSEALLEKFPSLRAIGMDFISVTRYANRPEGRAAHRVFLAKPKMILIEDMDLRDVPVGQAFQQVIVSPLMIKGGDGAPALVLGFLK